MELKLVPSGDKLEARLRGPNITPGYWRQRDLTAQAFDEEGFYQLGDALKFADPADPGAGLLFDGRIAEDFKLATGTWVSVGPLRARLIEQLEPYARDVVIAGADRDEIGALIFPESRRLPERWRPAAGGRAGRRCCAISTCCAVRGSDRVRQDQHRQLEPRLPRDPARRAALARRRRDDRQGLDQPARGAAARRADLVDELYAPQPLAARAS